MIASTWALPAFPPCPCRGSWRTWHDLLLGRFLYGRMVYSWIRFVCIRISTMLSQHVCLVRPLTHWRVDTQSSECLIILFMFMKADSLTMKGPSLGDPSHPWKVSLCGEGMVEKETLEGNGKSEWDPLEPDSLCKLPPLARLIMVIRPHCQVF